MSGAVATVVRKVLPRALILLLSVAAGYLIIANWVLTRLAGWASGEDLSLSYDSAYTWLPGRVEIENLTLRTSDANVQVELRIAHASVDVNLLALATRHFHATRVETVGTEFRMRHKLFELGDDAARVAAYPPIQGFEGPPLYELEPYTPPTDTWTIHLERVSARVTRLWVVEYDYRGEALARGAFELHPQRFLRLDPSTLRLLGGELAVGEHLVAQQFDAVLTARIAPTQIEPIHGVAIFEPVTAQFDARMQGGDLAFTDVYTSARTPLGVKGPFGGTIHVGLERGTLTPNSRVQIESKTARLQVDGATFVGDWAVHFDVDSDSDPSRLRLAASSERFAESSGGGPSLHQTRAELVLQPTQVHVPITRQRVALETSLQVPDVGWLERWSESELGLSGRGHAKVAFAHDVTQGASGTVNVSFDDLVVATDDVKLEVRGSVDAKFGSDPDAWLALRNLHGTVARGSFEVGGERWAPWSLGVSSNSFRLLREPLALQTTMDVELTHVGGLAELVLPLLPARIAAQVFGLEHLKGRVAWYESGTLRRLELLQARSGSVRAQGAMNSTGTRTHGAVYLETPVTDFGITFDRGETEVTLKASRDILSAVGMP